MQQLSLDRHYCKEDPIRSLLAKAVIPVLKQKAAGATIRFNLIDNKGSTIELSNGQKIKTSKNTRIDEARKLISLLMLAAGVRYNNIHLFCEGKGDEYCFFNIRFGKQTYRMKLHIDWRQEEDMISLSFGLLGKIDGYSFKQVSAN